MTSRPSHPGDKKRPHPPGAAADLGGSELDLRRRQRLYTAEKLRQGRTPLEVIEVVGHAVAAGEEAVAAAKARTPPRGAPACREGCAWCCHKRVGTAAPEVLRIVAYLRESLSADQWQALGRRVVEAAGRRKGNRGTVPCPLLAEDRCLAYPVRPLTCRGYNSSDASRCQRSLDPGDPVEVPVYAPQQRLLTFALDGLRAGLQECRLDGELLELSAALAIALQAPDAGVRWLAGEAVFAPARLR